MKSDKEINKYNCIVLWSSTWYYSGTTIRSFWNSFSLHTERAASLIYTNFFVLYCSVTHTNVTKHRVFSSVFSRGRWEERKTFSWPLPLPRPAHCVCAAVNKPFILPRFFFLQADHYSIPIVQVGAIWKKITKLALSFSLMSLQLKGYSTWVQKDYEAQNRPKWKTTDHML